MSGARSRGTDQAQVVFSSGGQQGEHGISATMISATTPTTKQMRNVLPLVKPVTSATFSTTWEAALPVKKQFKRDQQSTNRGRGPDRGRGGRAAQVRGVNCTLGYSI